ncbi:MAG: glycoside hydrolase family 16 protein [bacterium]|nr:glycoside hydrolase family 16 protein [bacterium]
MLSFAILFSGCITISPQNSTWELVFEENFDGAGAPNPNVWGYELGYVRNKELQLYTDHTDYVYQKDGVLNIRAHRAEDGNIYSGSIHTLGKQDFLYGKIEVRAKLPKGQGVWPAIWMMGVNRSEVRWPYCGEIDIMEYVWGTPKTVYATCHWWSPQTKKHARSGSQYASEVVLDGDWHRYTLIWTPTDATFYFDDIQYAQIDLTQAQQMDGSNPFQQPFYLLLNLAIGGGWGGALEESTLPALYQIDYVRYWKTSAHQE